MKKRNFQLKYIGMGIIIFIFFFAMGAGISTYVNMTGAEIEPKKEVAENNVSTVPEGTRTNILVLGVDKRPGEDNSRSDTMLLVSVDPQLDKVAIVSIPRDTRVDVPGSPLDKINSANYAGGPEYAVKIVEDFMDVDIDYYMEMDFNGFKAVIDTLGGVSINVPTRMYKPLEGINLYPGTQKLDGKQALAFVRYRDYEFGDIERTAMQQDFLQALADEILQTKTIPKLPSLIKEAKAYIETDMGLSDMLRLASWAPGFSTSSIITQTLPGYFYDLRSDEGELEQSYWIADQEEARELLDNMFAGKTVAVIQTSPYPVYIAPEKTEETAADEPDTDSDAGQDPVAGPDGYTDSSDPGSDQDPGLNPDPGVETPSENAGPNDTADISGPEGYI